MALTAQPLDETAETPADDSLSSVEVCAIAGISYRQLDYWSAPGVALLHPTCVRPGSGRRKRFAPKEAQVARFGQLLIQAGFTVPEALRLARVLVDTERSVYLAGGLVVLNGRWAA